MKTTHRLMAAFYLCGLLFLYHIDSVNSLRCKVCSYTDPNCNSGNVAERECQPNHTCAIIREFSTVDPGHGTTMRGCATEAEGSFCVSLLGTWKRCQLYCSTDNCNSASNLGE
ncbi:uncharacterized protein LOC112568347 isoform X1 [Pomacea canaliculata]|uniref:uncharacterized protein LOC112568347 isoform X1 n=1 Tax=Pomacea canaliculata TaxID=400727 RepID=UPI000D733203|nr:uncharacterized protein LOC112568347 isoform X1 [Pomacea canaliculata]